MRGHGPWSSKSLWSVFWSLRGGGAGGRAGGGGGLAQQHGRVGRCPCLRAVLGCLVPPVGGFHRLDQGDQQVQDHRGPSPAARGAGCLLQGACGGSPAGAGSAFEGAGAGGAGGLLERRRCLLEAVADECRGVRGGDGQEVTESGDVTRALGASGRAEEHGGFTDPGLGGRPVDRARRKVVALADPGQGEVVGELAAGEPDRPGAAVGAVSGERDRVAEEDAGLVASFPHAQARVAAAVEELGVAGGEGGGLADRALQDLAGGLRHAPAVGFRELAHRRETAGGAVGRRHGGQAPAGFELPGGGVHAEDVAADPGLASIGAGEGGHDVDVVGCVTDRDPAAGVRVTVLGDTRGVNHCGRGLGPLGVGQETVVVGVTDRGVPHVLRRAGACQGVDGGIQEQGQRAQ